MKINHFQIARWGTATLHWDGTADELKYFKAWVKRVIPKIHYSWNGPINDKTKRGREFNRTHLAGSFDLTAWVLMCTHWTGANAPAIGQVWKEKNPNYPFETACVFGEKAGIIEHDMCMLSHANTELQRSPRKKRTVEVEEAIAFLREKEQILREAMTDPEGYAIRLKQRPKPTAAERAAAREKKAAAKAAIQRMKERIKEAKARCG